MIADTRLLGAMLAVFCAILLSGCVSLPPATAGKGRVAALQATAMAALENGQPQLARQSLEEAGGLDPANIETLSLLLQAYRLTDDRSALRHTAERILVLQPEHSYALTRMGMLELEAGRLSAASEYLHQAVAGDSTLWEAWNGLGIIADVDQRFSEAESHYRRGLDAIPGHPRLLANLGWSRALAGDFASAELLMRESLQTAPDSAVTRSNLAFSIAMQGRYEEAFTLYSEFYGDAIAANNVGFAALQRGDQKSAESYLNNALQLQPSYYERAANNLQRLE